MDNKSFRETPCLLLPSDVAGMLDEVKLPGQLREHMQQIWQKDRQVRKKNNEACWSQVHNNIPWTGPVYTVKWRAICTRALLKRVDRNRWGKTRLQSGGAEQRRSLFKEKKHASRFDFPQIVPRLWLVGAWENCHENFSSLWPLIKGIRWSLIMK